VSCLDFLRFALNKRVNHSTTMPVLPTTALDFTTFDEVDLRQFLEEDAGNGVLVDGTSGKAVTMTSDLLKRQLLDPNRIIFPCLSSTRADLDRRNAMAIVNLQDHNVVVPLSRLNDVAAELRAKDAPAIKRAFVLLPTEVVLPRTATMAAAAAMHGTAGSVRQQRPARTVAIGSHHCQDGTDRRVYRIVVAESASPASAAGGGQRHMQRMRRRQH
jgi:hypothetical protein